jgi:hypothetical protein
MIGAFSLLFKLFFLACKLKAPIPSTPKALKKTQIKSKDESIKDSKVERDR